MDGQVLRFDEVTSIWFRRPNLCAAHPSIVDEEVRAVVEKDCGEFLGAVWESMDCLMLPGTPSAMKIAQRKPTHMARAKALGFDIAPTPVYQRPSGVSRSVSRARGSSDS